MPPLLLAPVLQREAFHLGRAVYFGADSEPPTRACGDEALQDGRPVDPVERPGCNLADKDAASMAENREAHLAYYAHVLRHPEVAGGAPDGAHRVRGDNEAGA